MAYQWAVPAALGAGQALGSAIAGATARSGKYRKLPTMDPQQQQLANFAGQFGQQQIQNPTAGFEPIAQRARSQFYQNTVPTLAERFTNMSRSGGGALSSPAFASQLGAAGAGLDEGLAALAAQYGQNQQNFGLNLLNTGLSPQFENIYEAGGPTALSSLFGAGSQIAGTGLDYYLQRQNLKSLISGLKPQETSAPKGAAATVAAMQSPTIGFMKNYQSPYGDMAPMQQNSPLWQSALPPQQSSQGNLMPVPQASQARQTAIPYNPIQGNSPAMPSYWQRFMNAYGGARF